MTRAELAAALVALASAVNDLAMKIAAIQKQLDQLQTQREIFDVQVKL